jgi:hypothetical protein
MDDDTWIPTSAQPRAPTPSRGRHTRKHKRDQPGATADLPRRATKIARLDSCNTAVVTCGSNCNGSVDIASITFSAAGTSSAAALSPGRDAPRRSDASPLKPLPPRQATTTPPKTSPPKTKVVLQPNGIARPLRVPFDPYHANPSGHQSGEGPATDASWRARRQAKLAAQFGGGIAGCFARAAAAVAQAKAATTTTAMTTTTTTTTETEPPSTEKTVDDDGGEEASAGRELGSARSQILRGVVVYVDGSTMPLVSDHRLRRLVAQHGGGVSAYLARRAVTHVVLTRKTRAPPPPPGADPPADGGPGAAQRQQPPSAVASRPTTRASAGHERRPFRAAGGGLAAGKMQREIVARRGAGIKYVTAAWILESIRAGRRLPEWRFADWHVAHERQPGVARYFAAGKTNVYETTAAGKCAK